MNKFKKIKYARSENWINPPSPTKNFIPKWYKDSPLFLNDKMKVENYSTNKTFKACIPFLESLRIGYVIELWTDVVVESVNGIPKVSWPSQLDPISIRPEDKILPRPDGTYKTNFIWNTQHILKLPKGYSCLFTHPLNRHDLPFISLSGVVDNDTHALGQGSYPFFIKDGFEGIIPAGTPILQMIPFKRDSWKLEEDLNLIDEVSILSKKSNALISGFYKKNIWKKKDYS